MSEPLEQTVANLPNYRIIRDDLRWIAEQLDVDIDRAAQIVMVGAFHSMATQMKLLHDCMHRMADASAEHNAKALAEWRAAQKKELGDDWKDEGST